MDVKICLAHINKSKRKKLAHRLASMTDKASIVAIQGWSARTKPRSDGGGLLVLLVRDAEEKNYPVRLVLDECCGRAGENLRTFPLTPEKAAALADMLAPWAPPVLFPNKPEHEQPEKPFSGWRGGRPRRVLNDEEKAAIDAARATGKTIDVIASDMHISNRVVSSYLKMSK